MLHRVESNNRLFIALLAKQLTLPQCEEQSLFLQIWSVLLSDPWSCHYIKITPNSCGRIIYKRQNIRIEMNCPHWKELNSGLTRTKCQWRIQYIHIASFTSKHTCMQDTNARVCVFNEQRAMMHFSPVLPSANCVWNNFRDCCATLSSEMTFQASRNTQRGSSSFLTCTFALIGPLWDVRVGGSIDAYGAIWDPGLVNTSFHPLHDKIQQDVHSLADILPVGSTCLKVWNSAPRRKSVEHFKKNPWQTQKQSSN